MDNKEEYIVLFKLGCCDLQLVEKNLKDEGISRGILLFHLQQAGEKFLKSLLSFKDIKFPRIHDIERLIELCEENKVDIPEYVEDFVSLTPYAVEFRYGIPIEEDTDLEYYYKHLLDFKRFIEEFVGGKYGNTIIG